MENYDRYMHIMEYYSAMKMKKTADSRNNMVQSQMHYAVKEARLKKVHTVQFHLHDILD